MAPGRKRKIYIGDQAAPPTEDFILGVTEPTKANTGVLSGVARTTWTGSTTLSTAGQTYTNIDFPQIMNITAPNLTFINCYFSGTYTGNSGGGLVMPKAAACANLYFERCTFKPATPNWRYNGIYGHDFKLYRCQIEHTVDGVGIYNQFASTANVEIHGCWIGNLAWYYDDGGTSLGGHTDGTHNDGIQHGSSSNVDVYGNTFWGYKYDVLGTGLYPDYQPSGGDSRKYPQIGQIFLTQHSAYFHVSNISVQKNFVYGGDNGIKAISNCGVHGGTTLITVDFSDNIWMDDNQRDWGGSGHWFPMRVDTNTVLNGVRRTTSAFYTADSNNRYSTGSLVTDPAKRGQLVKFQVEARAATTH